MAWDLSTKKDRSFIFERSLLAEAFIVRLVFHSGKNAIISAGISTGDIAIISSYIFLR